MLEKRFNGGKPLKEQQKIHIENYFEYRWNNDKGFAISSEEDQALLNQLPEDVIIKIYKFLYSEFLKHFRGFFTFFKNEKQISNVRSIRTDIYTWNDHDYQQFIIEIMTSLEPRHCLDQELLFIELDDVE